jgi:hypothetical protein
MTYRRFLSSDRRFAMDGFRFYDDRRVASRTIRDGDGFVKSPSKSQQKSRANSFFLAHRDGP